MTILETLTRIVGELNERCFDESLATGTGIKPFELCTTGEEVWVNFLGNPVLTDDEINDGNDPDEAAWRKTIEDEAIDYLLAIREFTIRDAAFDKGRCKENNLQA